MATYYIKLASQGGSNSNNGTSEATAWATLTYAATKSLVGGDIIYVKAGAYGREEISWIKSGTSGNPITIQGYKTTPGDQPPIVVDASNPVAALISTDMPTWTMTNGDYETFIDCRGCDNLTFKNLQVGGYGVGFRCGISSSVSGYATQHTNLTFYNIACKTLGNGDNYSGIGLNLGDMGTYFTNYSTVTKCLVTNAGAEAISVFGDYNQVTDCWTYINDPARITDYHYLCTGNHNDYLRVKGEVANDFPALHQGAHGLSFKTNAEQRLDHASPQVSMDISAQYNTATDCTMINIAEGFVVRHRTSQFNAFLNCKAYGVVKIGTTSPDVDDFSEGNCVVIRDGASNNTFNKMYAENCECAIRINDTTEDGDTPNTTGNPGPTVTGHPSNNNIVSNLLAINSYIAIDYNDYNVQSDTGTNKLENCTFYNSSYTFGAGRPSVGMSYKNCIFVGSQSTRYYGWIANNSYPIAGSQFSNCNFWNITGYPGSSFTNAGSNCKAVDPLFTNAVTKNFHLQPGSQMYHTGTSTGVTNTADYEGVARSAGNYSMGAFETVQGITNTPPAVSISSPLNGAVFTVGDTVNITATASDSDGTVSSVQFFVDGVSVGTDSGSPFTGTYTAVAGTHSITAVATDNSSATTTSSAISITVSPPVVPITNNKNVVMVSLNYSRKKYYVTLSGNNTASGLSEVNSWRTLTYALSKDSPVVPGDTIYVKAGAYGYEQILVEKTGLAGSPIRVKGYKSTPEDQPPMVVDASDPYASLVSTDMPTYINPGTAAGFGVYAPEVQYMIFENLQFSNYFYGFSVESETNQNYDSHITIFNCATKNIGPTDATNADFRGYGFVMGSLGTGFVNRSRLIKCLAVNCQAEAIFIGGDYNEVIDCKVFCNDINRLTDYYIFTCGSYNLIKGCYIERLSSLVGNAHGIGFKTNAEQVVDAGDPYPVVGCYYNVAIDCEAKNIAEPFYVRHRGAQYNTFYNCKSTGIATNGSCVVIRDGASFNSFERMYCDGGESGIRIFDTAEDGDTGGTPPGHPNGLNYVFNSDFRNTSIAIYFDAFSVASDAGQIKIYNCTFYKSKYMFSVNRTANQMQYVNCIFYGNSASPVGGEFIVGPNGSTVVASQFTYCDFFNIEGGLPFGWMSGTPTSVTVDPLFISSTNLRLQPTSTIKDAGTGTVSGIVKRDFDGQTRPFGSGYSIGAYER